MHAWLSVWLKPGDTLERVLVQKPRHSIWLLAAFGGIANIIIASINFGWAIGTVDWRVMTAIAFGGALVAVASLYFQAWCLRWSGRLFGGQASALQLRTLLAWGYFLPLIVVSTICLFGLALLTLAGHDTTPLAAEMVVEVLQIIFFFGLWSLCCVCLPGCNISGRGAPPPVAQSVYYSSPFYC